jgi:ABC-type Co2+ transport system permease subunit
MPYWSVDDILPILVCWMALAAVSWWVSRQKPREKSPLRTVLAVVCGAFAVLAGAFSVLMIAAEIVWGQAHGPSPLWIGLFCLPFAIFAAVLTRWLLGRDTPTPRGPQATGG